MIALVGVASQDQSRSETTNPMPDFREVYDLVAQHASGLSASELNRAAVQGLVSALDPRVSLLPGASDAPEARSGPLVSKASLFEGDIAYVRIGRVDAGLTEALRKVCQDFAATTKLKGVVIDLRFSAGSDYGAAAETADLFVKKEQPLLNWGSGVVLSKEKETALASPVAVLVNGQTAGASEALAAVLRETGVGLLLGRQTAGKAMVTQEFALSNGQRLRIATAPVQLADGTALSDKGLKPDVIVAVSPPEERAFYADAFQPATNAELSSSVSLSLTNRAASTNRPGRRLRFNEAELVRERREGLNPPDTAAEEVQDNEPEKPVVRDPVLARALDLLKGLAVVRQSHS